MFKRFEKCLIGFLTLAIFAVIATVVAYAGILGTKHDLSVTGPGPIKATVVTERCVFCHTPHGGNTGVYPLWNHQLSTATYVGPQQGTAPFPTLLSPKGWGTTGGTGIWQAIGDKPDGGAKLCLSCHDGTVAIGAVLNTPGHGSTGSITMTDSGTGLLTGGGALAPASSAYLGTNFVTPGYIKHPFSIVFDNNLVADKIIQCSPPNCQTSMALQLPTDPAVQLKPTSNTYKGVSGLGVQCRTCHDPHDNVRGAFLVKGNPSPGDNSPLCDTCHILCPNICM